MRISTRGRYALRVMIDLAQHQDSGYISLKHIGERQQLTQKYLEQIVSLLCKAKLISSARGAGGGYRLAKPPAQYTAGEILRATEGSLAPVQCVENKAAQCGHHSLCTTFFFWQGLSHAINTYVDSITLDELALGNGRAACALPPPAYTATEV